MESIKKAISIVDLAEKYGAQPHGTGKTVHCKFNPLRDEKTSSLKLYPETNSWNDFGDKGGSIIDFIMAADGITMIEAVNKIKSIAGIQSYEPAPVRDYTPKASFMSPDIVMKIWNQQPEITFDNGKDELLAIAPKYVFDEADKNDISSFHEIVRFEKQSKSLFVLLKDELGTPRSLRYRRFAKYNEDLQKDVSIKWYAQPHTQSSFLYTHTKDAKELYLIVEGTHDYLSAILCGYNVIAVPSAKYKIPDEVLKNKMCVFIDDDDGKDFMKETFDNAKCSKILFDHKEFKKVNKIKEAKDFSDYLEHFKSLEDFKKAISIQCDIIAHDTYTAPANRLQRFSDLTDNIKAPEWMVRDILPNDGLLEIVGASGSYKSFIVLDLMFCISCGIDYHKKEVKQGICVYVAGEGKTGAVLRVRALERHYGVKAENFYILPMPANLMDANEMDLLASDIKSISPNDVNMVMFDTLHRNSSGSKENSSDDFAVILGNIDKYLKPLSKIVGYVHHTGKGENSKRDGRGTSSRFGAVDTSLFIEFLDDKVAGFECLKQKDGEMFDKFGFTLKPIDIGILDEYGEPVLNLYPVLFEGKLPDKDAKVSDDDTECHTIIYEYLVSNKDGKSQSEIQDDLKDVATKNKIKKTLWMSEHKGNLWNVKKGDKNAWIFTAIQKSAGGYNVVETTYNADDMELF